MWRLVGFAFSAAAMAALLLSVAHEVKITSSGCAPINSATCSRAVSMYRLEHSFRAFASLRTDEFVARIAPFRREVRHHSFQHLRQNRRGRVVVKIDHETHPTHDT